MPEDERWKVHAESHRLLNRYLGWFAVILGLIFFISVARLLVEFGIGAAWLASNGGI